METLQKKNSKKKADDLKRLKTWIVNIAMPGETAEAPIYIQKEIVMGPKSDRLDVRQEIFRKNNGSGGEYLGNGRVTAIYEKGTVLFQVID